MLMCSSALQFLEMEGLQVVKIPFVSSLPKDLYFLAKAADDVVSEPPVAIRRVALQAEQTVIAESQIHERV